ncbi:UNVERIFIED_CONTAM: hypothetical protein HDU68_000042 [Siphonaria sp. JEL0065]|nr:hypothetical protein HDU68_000042 [Siphonaria sp. JEL0065]
MPQQQQLASSDANSNPITNANANAHFLAHAQPPPLLNQNQNQLPPPILVMDSISSGAPFVQKRIDLSNLVKIGRKVNVKAGPEPGNGIFDSKVLSRNHAEIWYEGGKVWVKDVKSSNGTFINGIRLSEEGQPSAPHELKTGDTVEFGIDIMNDDGLTVMYYKVSSKVILWDLSQGPLPAPSTFSASKSGENWYKLIIVLDAFLILKLIFSHRGTAPNKKAPIKMDAVFSMLDEEIRKASATSDQINRLKNELTEIDQLVTATTQLNGTSPVDGYLPPHPQHQRASPTAAGTVSRNTDANTTNNRPTVSAKAAIAAETSTTASGDGVAPSSVTVIGGEQDAIAVDLGLQQQQNQSDDSTASTAAASPSSVSATTASTTALTSLKSQVKSQEQVIAGLNERLGVLESELAAAKQRLAEANKNLKETRDLSQPIYKDNEDLKKKRQEVEAELVLVKRVEGAKVAELEKRLADVKKECDALKEREEAIIETSLATTTAQKQHLKSLESEVSKLVSENKNLQEKLDSTVTQLANQRQESATRSKSDLDALEKLSQESENMYKEELKRLEGRVKECVAKCEGYEAQIRGLEDALKSANVVLGETVKAFESERGSLLERIQVLSAEGGGQQQEDVARELGEKHRIALGELNGILASRESEINKLKKEHEGVIEKLETKIKEVEASKVEVGKTGEARLKDVEALVKSSEEKWKDLESKCKEGEVRLKETRNLLKESETQLKAKETLLQSKESLLKSKDVQLKDNENQLKAKETLLQTKESLLKEKEVLLKAKDGQWKESATLLKTKETQLKESEVLLKARDGQLKELESQLKAKDVELKELAERPLVASAAVPSTPSTPSDADSGMRQRKKGGKNQLQQHDVAPTPPALTVKPVSLVQNVSDTFCQMICVYLTFCVADCILFGVCLICLFWDIPFHERCAAPAPLIKVFLYYLYFGLNKG